jgi:hypothetical protein
MKNNHAYSAAIASGMERADMQMQPALKLANRKPLPSSAQEMTEHVECLLDIREECSLSSEEACRLTDQVQAACDRATD